ncbi:hypothetical protein EDD86DRAFT_208047 [Gorgonomyces haynaldii]|nr:hypothetical protein EDD86DRAFT_208047 [Gorgonomyces haynaldii]
MRREILSDDPYSLEAEEFDIVLPFWGAFFIGPGYYLARMAQPMDTRKIRFMKQVDYLLLTQGVITLGLHAFLVIDVMRWCNLTENLANDDCDTADASSFLYSMLLKFGIQFLSSLILVISVVLDFVGSWCGRDKASKVAKRLSKQQREEQKGRMIDHQPASTQIRIR